MSNVAVERPSAFPITVGFRVQEGFDLPQVAPPATPTAPAVASGGSGSSSFLTPQQQLATLSSVPPQSAEWEKSGVQSGLLLLQRPAVPPHMQAAASVSLASSLPTHKALSAVPTNLVNALSTDVAPNSLGPVGWKGLLEFSETSGCSGVLGPKTHSEDLDSILNRDCKIEICCTAHTSPAVRRLVKSVIRGLRACQEPEKAVDGMGGTYFFTNDSGKKAAILKPCDEEPLAPNNPKGYVGRQLGDPGWKPTVRVGEAAIREVAAYLLDHDGWARVPTSVLVRARHPVFCYQASRTEESPVAPITPPASSGGAPPPAIAGEASTASLAVPASPDSLLPMKLGSLQEFVNHECDTSEMGPGRFSVRDVHRIGILDLRLFNTDRHAGNMLVRTPRTASASTADLRSRMVAADAPYELIPIDHGFCLPETLEAPYFEWLHWPQTMLPFSEDELQYIEQLNVKEDKRILHQELPMLRPECLRVLEVCTTLLKTCAAAGLTLFDIASVMTRPFVDADEEPSELERMCAYARQCVEYAHEMAQCAECYNDESESDSEGAADELTLDEAVMNEEVGQVHRRLGGTISSIKEEGEDGLLFELDVDSINGVPVRRRQSGAGIMSVGGHAPESSPESSPCSSLSDGGMSMPAAGVPAPSSSIPIVGGMADPALARVAAIERPVPMASSVHVTDGFLWRKLKSQQAAKRVTAGKGAMTCPKRGRMAPQVYPPPVAAFSPERMSACFTGMTEEEWEHFMMVIGEQIEAALESGRWRQSTADLTSGMAASCPRF
ncbi:hypothetical protein HYH03_016858 [Edaphochlamys debaryana]|uniref:1-phosphatidylinositol 4-kinase n=1 Tax=Edaphochlamys debaryana TaxID=47281 RepID=A0A836BPG4_9CHLO|nr:hypothetical protein HYH03_016858 [Edaphochlamys debaryana]|eukprot:KAG2484316.1 hypothetical protein HYH03_016858 [Edaphochlamys debaryana]